ncbi:MULTISPECIES: TraB/GumN family protein [unclassified Sphingopyxis]|uniref:TraB/GumN family protein n=1 Tax=unclassified Sphingopyxis TaxID=2614943 RepID=UPI000ACE149B|nr:MULTISPECIES: TraB/GumN family protein [unclassified Sphingopyxis]
MPCLLAACGTAEPTQQAKPAMWLVADDDTQIYMLGAMHALPRGTDWHGDKVADAIGSADELVMELSPEELAEAGGVFQSLAPRTAPLAMEKRLPPPALAGYRALEANGGDFGGDTLDDWAVMVLMGQRVAQNAELDSSDGVETRLTEQFKDARKPIRGLETAREQLMLFETLDAKTQRTLLTRAAEKSGDAVKEVGALTAAWGRGDVAALEKVINEDVDTVPAARKAIITDRNRRWSAWVQKRLEQPGTVLMAVGAGHLVGADGVPAMLEADGLKVTRVQ